MHTYTSYINTHINYVSIRIYIHKKKLTVPIRKTYIDIGIDRYKYSYIYISLKVPEILTAYCLFDL